MGSVGEDSCYDGDGKESSTSDDDENSSSLAQSVEDALENFRDKWKKELEMYKNREYKKVKEPSQAEDDTESVAKRLFLNGAEMERSGQLYEAIQFYRRAVQLVPDIEFRLHTRAKNVSIEHETEETLKDVIRAEVYEDQNNSCDDDKEIKDLYNHIQRKMIKSPFMCIPANEQKVTHISALPLEILLYIFRWVVSNEIDMRSLEICSFVCRGFYLCCRDSEIWRLACARIWGINVTLPRNCASWRQMFIESARLSFNGCYIGKTTYIRSGENSFQDQFYRPWHIVAYYRYLRFFPDGMVLMLTSPDEPAVCVGQLKYRAYKNPTILSGHYWLKDDKVTIIVYRNEKPKNNFGYKRNKKRDVIPDNHQETFHLEMQIQDYKNQRHIRLAWTGYSVYTRYKNGVENTCHFDLIGNRFPPLWFSRVKSYTTESYSPL
ncbi:hypothetical protein RI129_001973 [Pyrocoelia pectoralis]|uniref:F-box only protein 9 n=1 Tax=Pyrocoelia pectoralis TaxID=417401 RepID=A0AAN7W0Y8_9COLE